MSATAATLRTTAALGLLLATFPLNASAISYTSATRTVSANLGGSVSTEQLGPWSDSRVGRVAVGDENLDTYSSASQDSDLAPDSISFSSSLLGSTIDGPGPGGSSSLLASFSIDHPVLFTATGSYGGYAEGTYASIGIEVSMVGVQGEVFAVRDSESVPAPFDVAISGPISGSGILAPGDYVLVASFAASARYALDGECSMVMTFVPEPGSLCLLGIGLLGIALKERSPVTAR